MSEFLFNKKEYCKIFLLRFIGNFLIIFSVFVIVKTLYEPLKQEIIYFKNIFLNKKYSVVNNSQLINSKPQKGILSSLTKSNNIEILTPIDPNFSIIIPKIGANAKIIPNIDPTNEDEYLSALREGVAHTKGSFFPGEGGHIVLFAHSTDYFWNITSYNAIFYLLYKLEKGDEVDIFYKGQRIVYRVVGQKIVNPDEVEFITQKTKKEYLTLQTCWPLGTTLQRLLVFAERISE